VDLEVKSGFFRAIKDMYFINWFVLFVTTPQALFGDNNDANW